MTEETALTILESSDLENVGVTATDASGLPHMQEAVLRWCRTKVARCRVEAEDDRRRFWRRRFRTRWSESLRSAAR